MTNEIDDNINRQTDRAIVLICSSDGYEDAWMPFFTLFRKYWPDCPYKIILNTETKEYSFEGLDIKCLTPYKTLTKNKVCKIPYGERMLDILSKIDSEYIILLMEDFFLRSKVNNSRIVEILDWMDEDKTIATFNMTYSFNDYDLISEKYKGFRLAANYSDFKQSMLAGIWRKDVFEKSWKKFESPWEWEGFGTLRTFNNGLKYYLSDYSNRYNPIFDFYDPEDFLLGITQGKWTENAVNVLTQNNIQVDFDKRGILYKNNNAYLPNKYTGKNLFKKIIICLDLKKINSILRSCGFTWLMYYIRWKIYVFRHKREEFVDFVQWYRKIKKIK